MASIKMCDIDGRMFVERAPGSIRVDNGTYYTDLGRAVPFSGEFCPECGASMVKTRGNFRALPQPVDYQDKVGTEMDED